MNNVTRFASISAVFALVACGGEPAAQSPSAATSAAPEASAAPMSAPAAPTALPAALPAGQPQGVAEGATPPAGMKLCTCELAPTEACSPRCAPHRYFAADCASANGRPRACK